MRVLSTTLIGLALALALAACNKAPTAVTDEDMSMGPATAKVTVIEYASASCSHCARWNSDVFPAFKAKYIDTGQVRYVYREFLTAPVPLAAGGFLLARCAGRDKYFKVLDAVYRAQEEMFNTGDFRGGLLRIAQGVGMTEAQFNACVSDEAAMKALNTRVEGYQRSANINSTPTFVINGKTYVGEQPLAALDAAIAEANGAPAPAAAPAAAGGSTPAATTPAAAPAATPAAPAAATPAAPAAAAPAAPAPAAPPAPAPAAVPAK